MIEVFKLVNDMYYLDCTNLFRFRDQSKRVTRGNKKKLFKYRVPYGVGGSLVSWFQNYISDRYQRVLIRGQASELGLIEAGVPQGSVLGPLLFLTYINDLPAGVESNMKLYADDLLFILIILMLILHTMLLAKI